jgi:hypothetical protein
MRSFAVLFVGGVAAVALRHFLLCNSSWTAGLKVWDLPFIAHFGEVAGWVPYIGVGGFDVFTTMYRSRSGTKSELAGGVLSTCHNFLLQVFDEEIDILCAQVFMLETHGF